MRVAVRFFYPEAVTPTGFRSGICVGINGLRDFPGDRDVGLEAFAFQAIWRSHGTMCASITTKHAV